MGKKVNYWGGVNYIFKVLKTQKGFFYFNINFKLR